MATKKVELRRKNDGTFEEEIVVRSDWDIIDNVPAVFPPEAHTHPVEDIDATGTLDSTTFLRGDGVWSAAGDIIALENAAGDGLVWDVVNNEFDVVNKMEVDGSNSNVLDLKFQNQSTEDALAVGEIRLNNNLPEWQVSANTLHLVGQQLITRAVNRTGAQVSTGTPIYISGVFTPVGPGTDIKEYELASSETEFATFAVVSCPAPNNEEGCIVTRGVVKGWNTSAYTAGDDLYLTTTPGQYTTTKPTSGKIVFIGKVVRAANDGIVFVNPTAEAEGARVIISETAPSNPAEGDLWFDSSLLELFIYYNDGNSTQWVGISGSASGGGAEVEYYTTTIATTDWSGTDPVTAVKTVSGILSTDKPLIDIDLSSVAFANVVAKQTEYSKLYRVAATAADTITFYALEAPTEELVISIKVVR
jgi:hypothetical protein